MNDPFYSKKIIQLAKAIDYINKGENVKALKKYNSNIMPISIPRFEAYHNDTEYTGNVASSTAIRNIIKKTVFFILYQSPFLNLHKHYTIKKIKSN